MALLTADQHTEKFDDYLVSALMGGDGSVNCKIQFNSNLMIAARNCSANLEVEQLSRLFYDDLAQHFLDKLKRHAQYANKTMFFLSMDAVCQQVVCTTSSGNASNEKLKVSSSVHKQIKDLLLAFTTYWYGPVQEFPSISVERDATGHYQVLEYLSILKPENLYELQKWYQSVCSD